MNLTDYRDGTRPQDAIEQPLTDDGTASGAFNVVGNYATATEVYFTALRPCVLTRMIVSISDTGAFGADEYGNGVVLTNGWGLKIVDADDNTLLDLLPEGNIKTNGELKAKCHDFDTSGATLPTGDTWGTARWTFGKDMPNAGFLLGTGHRLVATFQDNYTGLVRHRFDIRGAYVQ